MKKINRGLFSTLGLAILVTGAPQAHTALPGLDLFETDPATTYDDIDLPPGALLPYCDGGFTGRVFFQGSPIDCFGSVCNLAPTDTIVRRLASAPPPTVTIPIEIVALELRSVDPILVTCSGGPQAWNVRASVPEGDTNQTQGTMTIVHSAPQGGTFTSTLPVRPHITFTRVSDSATVGPVLMPLIVFTVTTPTPWCHRGNPLDVPEGDFVITYDRSTNFIPGIICPSSPGGSGQRRKVLTVEQAALAAHGVLPAEKNHHYKCFDIVGPLQNQIVTLRDQFGTRTTGILEPRYLCPPAKKNNRYGSFDSPHLKCYRITGTAPAATVNLKTQFGLEPNVQIGAPELLCAPAQKQVLFPVPTPAPTGPPPASPHYTCYKIVGPPPGATVGLETQFGVEPQVTVGPPRYLCAPTIKFHQNRASGSLREPHLKCYDIVDNDPPHVVNLTTQFGFEPNVPVGPPRLLCIPVDKRPTECRNLAGVKLNPSGAATFTANPVNVMNARYNFYRGDLQMLPSGYGTCLATHLTSPSVTDSAANPLPGRGFFYLATAKMPAEDGEVEGTLGFDSRGVERANADSCVAAGCSKDCCFDAQGRSNSTCSISCPEGQSANCGCDGTSCVQGVGFRANCFCGP